MKNIKPHLIVWTNAVFFQSTISVDDLIEFALNNQHTHVFFVCRGQIHSYISFYRKAIKAKLIPVCCFHMFYQHAEILLIAKNRLGYQRLLEVAREPERLLENLDDLFLVLLDGDLPLEIKRGYFVANDKSDIGIRVFERFFLYEKDYQEYCLLQAIRGGNSVKEETLLNERYKGNYLYREDDLTEYPDTLLEVWDSNMEDILEGCELYGLEAGKDNLKFSEVDEDQKKVILFSKALIKLKGLGLFEDTEYLQRLNGELEVIKERDYLDYFLIVEDFVTYCRENNILLGIGRGSVCGSLLAYLLDITNIDPIKYGLYFERFLNVSRLEIPDIDIDVDGSKRAILLRYLGDKYGYEHVVHLSIGQKYRFLQALKDCGKALGYPKDELIRLVKALPERARHSLEESKEYLESNNLLNKSINDLFNCTKKVINLPRGLSIHPSGVCISKLDISKIFPIYEQRGLDLKITNYTYEEIQSIGYVKFDILSLAYLELIQDVLSSIDEGISIHEIPLDDEEVWALLHKAHTGGVFQLEGEQSIKLLREYRPNSIIELANCIALIRPGAYSHIVEFINAKRGQVKVREVLLKDLEGLLVDTHGIMIYQEQIMEIVAKVTGCSFCEADNFRKAVSKKNVSLLNKEKEKFIRLGMGNGHSLEDLESVWGEIYKFAGYGFNKSHAVAYACMAYQTAWLKGKYPYCFYQSLLKCFGLKDEYVNEIFKLGLGVETPNIFHTYPNNKFVGKVLYLGVNVFPLEIQEVAWKVQIVWSEERTDTLLETMYLLIEGGIKKDEILVLNYVGYFNPLFKGKENQGYIEKNIDKMVELVLMGKVECRGMVEKEYIYVEEDAVFYQTQLYKKCGFKKMVKYVDQKVYDLNKAKSLIELDNQHIYQGKYVGKVVRVRRKMTKQNREMLWLDIASCNYSEVTLPYFGNFPFSEGDFKDTLFVFEIIKRGGKLSINSIYKVDEKT